MKLKLRRNKKGKADVKVTPISGNTLIIAITIVVVSVLAFIYLSANPQLLAGISNLIPTANPITSEEAVGDAVLDIGTDVQDISSLLKEMDDLIG